MVATNLSTTVDEARLTAAFAPPMDISTVAPAALAAQTSAGVPTLTVASMPSCQSTVPSDWITGNAAASRMGALLRDVLGRI